MKDAKGHGSEAHGGVSAATQEAQKFQASRSTHGKNYLDPFDPRYPDSAARLASLTGAHSAGVDQIGKPVNMQRRQYEAIAGAINNLNVDPNTKAGVASHFADALRGTNPNFDAGKFKTAATTGDMGRTQGKEPGMQSRHYEAVAGAIAGLPSGMRGSVATHFAGELGRKNSNFNSQRFIKAAGG